MAVDHRRKKPSKAREDLPVALRRLWGLSVPSRLGRRAVLDVERVVRTAVDLADRDGLTGVTLPRIAKTLGYTTMSLYRYVGSKDELLVLMRDVAIGAPPAIATPHRAWRRGLRRWAGAQRLLYQQRPWLARLPTSGPPAGPNQIAWMEIALRILSGTGLGWAEKVGIMTLISGYVQHQTQLSQDLERGRDGTGLGKAESEQRYGRSLVTLIDPNRFPETARLFASGVFEGSPARVRDDATADPDFTFGLERILDGVAAAIAQKRPTP
jgi:AcrR family transcriptional regulator